MGQQTRGFLMIGCLSGKVDFIWRLRLDVSIESIDFGSSLTGDVIKITSKLGESSHDYEIILHGDDSIFICLNWLYL